MSNPLKFISKFFKSSNQRELDNISKVVAKINALYPSPGSWFTLNGSRIKIIKAKEVKSSGKPGEILDDKFTIACSSNSIEILELQKEGKKNMSKTDFLKGNKIKIGTILNDI